MPNIFFGVVVTATIMTVALTPAVTLIVLRRLRRTVQRSMLATSHGPSRSTPENGPQQLRTWPPAGAVELLEPVHSVPASRGGPAARAHRQVRRAFGWYVAAGLAYAATQTVVIFRLQGQAFLPPRTVLVGFLLAWPIIPTLLVVMAPRRRVKILAIAAYTLAALVLGLFAGKNEIFTLQLWAVQEGPPTLALLSVAGRRLRAVGPFVAPAVFALGTILPIAWLVTLAAFSGVPPPLDGALALGAVAVAVAVALLAVPAAARRHQRKKASDVSILLDQWWLIFALYHCLLVAGTAGWWALAMLLPYGAYRLTVRFGRWRSYCHAIRHPPVRLLLLRPFGSRTRSEQLLRNVGAYWRYVGSVELIAGTDLATEALEPHEFLDFALGKLPRQFVTNDDLSRHIDQLDLQPDADGRFRVNQLFCHDDTWRTTVRSLLGATDVVLADLRSLDHAHEGVAYEIQQILAFDMLDQTVGLVDDTTDLTFLQSTLAAAAASAPTGTPKRLRILHVSPGRQQTKPLLKHLEAASTRPITRTK
jgi:hypothetical protein